MLAWWTGWASSPAGISWTFWEANCVTSRWEKGARSSSSSPVEGRPWCAKFSGRWLEQWQKRNWGSCLFSALRRWRGLCVAICGCALERGHREGKRHRNKLPHPVPRWAFVYCWLLLQQIFDTMGSRKKVLLHMDKTRDAHKRDAKNPYFFCTSIIAWCLFWSYQSSLNPTASHQLGAFLLSTLDLPFLWKGANSHLHSEGQPALLASGHPGILLGLCPAPAGASQRQASLWEEFILSEGPEHWSTVNGVFTHCS